MTYHHLFSAAHLFTYLLALGLAACSSREETESVRTEDNTDESNEYDVIIVGGGLAGLTAAHELYGRRILLLEREERLGGRVLTRNRQGVNYELGALMAYQDDWLPIGAAHSHAHHDHDHDVDRPVGYSESGVTYFGTSPEELVYELEGRTSNVDRFVKNYAARRAFFGVIHPGDYADYISRRTADWRSDHDLRSRPEGNAELIEALKRSTNATIHLGAEVSSVKEENERAIVEYTLNGKRNYAASEVVIVSTPPGAARKLLGDSLPLEHPARSIREVGGIVVVLGMQPNTFAPFSYIVSEDAGVNVVLLTERENHQMLTVYLSGANAEEGRSLTDEALIAKVVDAINSLNIGQVDAAQVSFSDIQRWETIGAIISYEPYEVSWNDNSFEVSERIILAGDYTYWTHEKMPYGMRAAVLSGRRAADRARARLLEYRLDGKTLQRSETLVSATERTALYAKAGIPIPNEEDGSMPSLTTCSVFEFSSEAPTYLGTVKEGSIAPYGWLLMANPSDNGTLADYLVSMRSTAGLWEYSPSYGVTSADSALVLEGLIAAGSHPEVVTQSLDTLRDHYFHAESGGFITLVGGRAIYWSGPSADTTALIAYLMEAHDVERYASEINAAATYLLREQGDDGLFAGRWFTSVVLPTSYAVRFLARLPDPTKIYQPAIVRATQALVDLQRNDGSVMGSVIETAFLAETLAVTKNHPEALDAARSWLKQKLAEGITGGDGVLHYWFDQQHGKRIFFECHDLGEIAAALAEISVNRAVE